MAEPTAATIYHDADADLDRARGPDRRRRRLRQPGPLAGAEPARLGLDVVVGNIRDACARAGAAPTASRCGRSPRRARSADVVMLLIPDEVMPAVYARARSRRTCAPATWSSIRLRLQRGVRPDRAAARSRRRAGRAAHDRRRRARRLRRRAAAFPRSSACTRTRPAPARARMLALAEGHRLDARAAASRCRCTTRPRSTCSPSRASARRSAA